MEPDTRQNAEGIRTAVAPGGVNEPGATDSATAMVASDGESALRLSQVAARAAAQQSSSGSRR